MTDLGDGGMPLVHIVVPVYNGSEFLAECLDSIARQTYPNWRATIINNCSTDATPRIADEYAKADRRFDVVHFDQLVEQVANYNRALAHVSAKAKYAKLLEADNWITDDAIARLVEVMEREPTANVANSHAIFGKTVWCGGIDYTKRVLTGAEALRLLTQGHYFFGVPGTLLYRTSALKQQKELFREGICHNDVDLCLRLLATGPMAFVHRILAFVRLGNGGISEAIESHDHEAASAYVLIEKYGSLFFEGEELREQIDYWRQIYYRRLGRAFISGRYRGDYAQFHKTLLGIEGMRVSRPLMARGALLEGLNALLNPRAVSSFVLRKLATRRRREVL